MLAFVHTMDSEGKSSCLHISNQFCHVIFVDIIALQEPWELNTKALCTSLHL